MVSPMNTQREGQPMGEENQAPLQPTQPAQWMTQLDERTQKHILFARVYRAEFAHGAPGHLDLLTIAALAQLLDNFEHHGSHLPQVSFTK
jgi:hypothetical protein